MRCMVADPGKSLLQLAFRTIGHVYFVSIGAKIGNKKSKMFEKNLTLKSFLSLHFKGFGAISPLRGCRSCFSVHFGIGDVQKAPTATRFKPILMFFTIFLGWRLAAGAFFFVPKIACSRKKTIFLGWRLAAGVFLGQK